MYGLMKIMRIAKGWDCMRCCSDSTEVILLEAKEFQRGKDYYSRTEEQIYVNVM
jgi:hypothetical protein